MNEWQEHAAKAIAREQRPNPLERMKIREDSRVGENYRRGWNAAIAAVISLEAQRDAFFDDAGDWTEAEKREAWGR